eukprot:scaffold185_cov233-Chaetoceros_neogracile.AAC.8
MPGGDDDTDDYNVTNETDSSTVGYYNMSDDADDSLSTFDGYVVTTVNPGNYLLLYTSLICLLLVLLCFFLMPKKFLKRHQLVVFKEEAPSKNENDGNSIATKRSQILDSINTSGRELLEKVSSVLMPKLQKNLRPSSRGRSCARLPHSIQYNIQDKHSTELSLLPFGFAKSPSPSLAEKFIDNPDIEHSEKDEDRAFEANDVRSKRILSETKQIMKLGTP